MLLSDSVLVSVLLQLLRLLLRFLRFLAFVPTSRGWHTEAVAWFFLLFHLRLVLLDVPLALLPLVLLLDLLRDHLCSWLPSDFLETHGLEPTFGGLHFALNLLNAAPVVVERKGQAAADLAVNVLRVPLRHWQAVVIAKETVLESE